MDGVCVSLLRDPAANADEGDRAPGVGNRVRIEGAVPGGGASPFGKWVTRVVKDETNNDSNKTFTVTNGNVWQLLNIKVDLYTSGIVGNRLMSVELLDGAGDVVYDQVVGATQPAESTGTYSFAPSHQDLEAFRDGYFLATPIPPTGILADDHQVRVRDRHAVHPGGDDMHVYIRIAETPE